MPRRLLATPVLLLPLVLGCSQDTTVSGTVTYDGKPVEDGFITFYPADQKGVNRGGEIRDGRGVGTAARGGRPDAGRAPGPPRPRRRRPR